MIPTLIIFISRRLASALLFVIPLLALPLQAQPPSIRISGDSAMLPVVVAWEEAFRRTHPDAHFENHLQGSDTAFGALYSGTADLALLGRESNQTEDDGFLHSLQYTPLKLQLMTGSLSTPGQSPAPVFFVHRTNPLTRISLNVAAHVFSCTPPCSNPSCSNQPGRKQPGRTWGDLGVAGKWKDRPIHLYTWDTRTGTGLAFIHSLLGPSKKLNWKIIHEFADKSRPDGTTYDAAEQILDALSSDPDGLATSTLRFASPIVKPLPVAFHESGPYVTATAATLAARTYPLTRSTYAFVNRRLATALPEPLAAFLRFTLSDRGQAIIPQHSGFLPLPIPDRNAQLALTRETPAPPPR